MRTAPPFADVVYYETQYYDDGFWYAGPTVLAPATNTEIANLDADTYKFRVRAHFRSGSLAYANTVSGWLTSADQNMTFLSNPPPTVTGFRINSLDATSTLTWDPIITIPVMYEIRFIAEGSASTDWNGAIPIYTNLTGTSVQVPTMVGTYLIKAVTQNGVKSLEAATIRTNILEILGLNAVATSVQEPTFGGTKEDVVVDGVNLVLAPTTGGVVPEGLYTFDTPIDLGEVFTSRVTPFIDVEGNDVTNNMDTWESLSTVPFLDTSNQSSWGVELEIRTATGVLGASPPLSPLLSPEVPDWGEWGPFFAGDVTARFLDFRLRLYGVVTDDEDTFATVTPLVKALSVQIDMPDRVVADKDIAASAGGSTITFSPAFRTLSGLGIAGQDMATGDYVVITNKSATGFTIQFKNAAGTGVSKTFDYVAKGYGSKV